MRTDDHKQLLMDAMRMSEAEYNELVYDVAIEYLIQVLEFDKWGRDQLEAAHHFWAWWKNQWARRNNIVVFELELQSYSPAEYKLISDDVRAEFFKAHSLKTLTIIPNRIVLEESFGEMINGMFDERNKKEVVK